MSDDTSRDALVYAVSSSLSPHLERVHVSDARELRRLFSELDYSWPPAPGPTVPRVAVDPLPGDFSWPADTRHRKNLFFKVLMPIVLAENRRVSQQRAGLEAAIPALESGDPAARASLEALARDYQVDGDVADPAVQQALRQRVDILPPALVLAQAANESGWGESRFAREGNNLFGVWTYRPDEGMVPSARPEGERYLVRRYDTLRASVRSHLYNLNIGHAYDELRALRADMRARGEEPDPIVLAAGLERYSERGPEYVDEIRAIIRGNGLERVARVELRDHAPALAVTTLHPRGRPLNLQVAATTVD